MTVIPYHPTRKFSHRPDRFRVVPDHPDNQGLVFAGLGNAAGSNYFHDSSVSGLHGAFAGYTPSVWETVANRKGIHTADGIRVTCPTLKSLGKTYTFSTICQLDGRTNSAIAGIFNNNSAFCYHAAFEPARHYHTVNDTNGLYRGFNVGEHELTDTPHHVLTRRNGTIDFETYIDGVLPARYDQAPDNRDWPSGQLLIGAYRVDLLSWIGTIADLLIWDVHKDDEFIRKMQNLDDVMLDGLIEPLPTQTYFLPLQPSLPYDIFESAIIGV